MIMNFHYVMLILLKFKKSDDFVQKFEQKRNSKALKFGSFESKGDVKDEFAESLYVSNADFVRQKIVQQIDSSSSHLRVNRGGKLVDRRQCYSCGVFGHIAKYCPLS